jgi:hypothetical protein
VTAHLGTHHSKDELDIHMSFPPRPPSITHTPRKLLPKGNTPPLGCVRSIRSERFPCLSAQVLGLHVASDLPCATCHRGNLVGETSSPKTSQRQCASLPRPPSAHPLPNHPTPLHGETSVFYSFLGTTCPWHSRQWGKARWVFAGWGSVSQMNCTH